MLTGTSELAIRALIVIALDDGSEPLSPNQLAEKLSCSSSYLAKVLRSLVRAGILDSYRGARGGVLLSRDPEELTLLEITEATQGVLVRNYCREIDIGTIPVCAFHEAMVEVREATSRILSRWTLQDLLERPAPGVPIPGPVKCKMSFRGSEVFHTGAAAEAGGESAGGAGGGGSGAGR